MSNDRTGRNKRKHVPAVSGSSRGNAPQHPTRAERRRAYYHRNLCPSSISTTPVQPCNRVQEEEEDWDAEAAANTHLTFIPDSSIYELPRRVLNERAFLDEMPRARSHWIPPPLRYITVPVPWNEIRQALGTNVSASDLLNSLEHLTFEQEQVSDLDDNSSSSRSDTCIANDDDNESHNNNTCFICYERFLRGDRITPLPCHRHQFHSQCLLPWFEQSRTCPICRERVTVASAVTLESGLAGPTF